MVVSKFKLLGNGSRGLKATCVESIQKNGTYGVVTVNDEVDRTRKVPVPWEIKKSINDLKYEFLVAIGRWDGSWSKYLNEDKTGFLDEKEVPTVLMTLWENVKVTGISSKSSGFVITGLIKIIGHKTITENSPFLTATDEDYEIYDDAVEKIANVMTKVETFLTDERFMHADPKQYLLELFNEKPDQKERISQQSIEESENEMIERLRDKGAIVILAEDAMPGIEEDVTDTKDLLEETDSSKGSDVILPLNNEILLPVTYSEVKEEQIKNIAKGNSKKKTAKVVD